jgi:general nucleoside transport system permease protein
VTARAEALQRLAGERLGGARGVGWLGVVLGLLAFWVALPPAIVRTPVVPVLLGLAAIAAGAWAIRRGVRRIGWGAVAAGLLGVVLGWLATRSSTSNLENVVVWSALLAATLRAATPLTFAALGGILSERSGVVNIGLEGMMLTGAFFGFYGADRFGSWFFGIVLAMVAGAMMALIHAVVSIHLRADQIVSGMAINFLALGVTGYFFVDIYKGEGTPSDVSFIPDVRIPGLEDVYFVGRIFGHLNLMIWVALALLVVVHVALFKTAVGLRLRSVGEHPKAADTVGISVYRTRYAGVMLSGILAALGGAYLSIGFVHSFSENMTVGKGFIALAAVIFGGWRPFGAFAAALLFGFSSAVADRMQVYRDTLPGIDVLIQALPYALTLIAVAGVIGRSIPPAAVGRPYVKQ